MLRYFNCKENFCFYIKRIFYPPESYQLDPTWTDEQIQFIYESIIFEMKTGKIVLSPEQYDQALGMMGFINLGP